MNAFARHILFTCLLAISVTSTFAQCTKKYDAALHRIIYTKADVMPEFPGGPDASAPIRVPNEPECLSLRNVAHHHAIMRNLGSCFHEPGQK